MSFAEDVWIVDDDSSIRWVMEKALTRAGLSCRVFESADEVLGAMASVEPMVVISDIRMPGMDGYEVAESFRARFPSLPVLFMTGYDADASRRQQMVNSRLLMKPMRRDDLAEALQGLTAG